MDFLVIEQVWGIALFFLGSYILSTCSKWERADREKMKDPKLTFGRRKSDMVAPKSIRGTLMTFIGCGFALGGMVLIIMHV